MPRVTLSAVLRFLSGKQDRFQAHLLTRRQEEFLKGDEFNKKTVCRFVFWYQKTYACTVQMPNCLRIKVLNDQVKIQLYDFPNSQIGPVQLLKQCMQVGFIFSVASFVSHTLKEQLRAHPFLLFYMETIQVQSVKFNDLSLNFHEMQGQNKGQIYYTGKAFIKQFIAYKGAFIQLCQKLL